MDLITDVIRDGSEQITAFAEASGKSFAAALLQAARGAVRHVISITPPATASNVPGGLDSGSDAKQRGYATIHRDLNHIFAPKRLKGMRKEMISAAQMVQIHQRLLATKRPGTPMRRDRAQPYYVDIRKFNMLETKLRANVGKLAGGWMPAATALNVRGVPAWVSRHGENRGSVEIQLEGKNLFVRAINIVSPHAPAWVAPEMERRAGYAVQYAMNDLTRQLPYVGGQAARHVGLGVT